VRTPAGWRHVQRDLRGLQEDPAEHLTVRFDADTTKMVMVMVRDIPMYSQM